MLKGLTTKALIAGLLVFTLICWVVMFTENQGSKSVETSVDGVISHIETSWAQVDTLTGVSYVPQAKVFFVEPEGDIELRAIFVTDFGEYWGDSHRLTMISDGWKSEPSLTIQGSRGLKHQGDLVAFQEQMVPPIQLWIFDQNNQQEEPLIKIPITN